MVAAVTKQLNKNRSMDKKVTLAQLKEVVQEAYDQVKTNTGGKNADYKMSRFRHRFFNIGRFLGSVFFCPMYRCQMLAVQTCLC